MGDFLCSRSRQRRKALEKPAPTLLLILMFLVCLLFSCLSQAERTGRQQNAKMGRWKSVKVRCFYEIYEKNRYLGAEIALWLFWFHLFTFAKSLRRFDGNFNVNICLLIPSPAALELWLVEIARVENINNLCEIWEPSQYFKASKVISIYQKMN